MTLRETEGENEWEKERNSVKYLRAIERKCADDDKTNRENFVSFLRYWPFAYSMNNGRARIQIQMHAHTHKHINRERGGKNESERKSFWEVSSYKRRLNATVFYFRSRMVYFTCKSLCSDFSMHIIVWKMCFSLSLSTCSRMSSVLFL